MTIGALSKELGISKQAVTKQIKALGLFEQLEKQGNRYIVPDDVVEQVRQRNHQPNANESQPNDNELAFLRKQIELKDQQIAALQTALDREQQLHAADKQQLLLLTAPKPRRGFFSLFKKKDKE